MTQTLKELAARFNQVMGDHIAVVEDLREQRRRLIVELLSRPNGPTFFLWGGHVRSRFDGQEHYIGCGQLVQLYGLPRSRCVFATGDQTQDENRRRGRIELGPRSDGDYKGHLAERLMEKW